MPWITSIYVSICHQKVDQNSSAAWNTFPKYQWFKKAITTSLVVSPNFSAFLKKSPFHCQPTSWRFIQKSAWCSKEDFQLQVNHAQCVVACTFRTFTYKWCNFHIALQWVINNVIKAVCVLYNLGRQREGSYLQILCPMTWLMSTGQEQK